MRDAGAPTELSGAGDRYEISGGAVSVSGAFQIEPKPLSLTQCAQPRPLDRGDVDERVARAVIQSDEAEPFGSVEEFYSPCRHRLLPIPNAAPAHFTLAETAPVTISLLSIHSDTG